MSLSWDLRNIKDTETLCWKKLEDGKSQMSPITETLIWATMFCYMDKITKETYKDFHRRLIELEIASGQGLIRVQHIETNEVFYRSPSLEEIEAHIGLATNATRKTKREWGSHLKRVLQDEAQRRIKLEIDEVIKINSEIAQSEKGEILV